MAMFKGSQLKNKKFVSIIGEGLCGNVKKYIDIKTKELIALKEISKDKTDYPYAEHRLLESIKGKSPYFLEIREHWEDCDSYFIMTEFIDGMELLDFFNKFSTTTENIVKYIFFHAACSIRDCHELDIVHMDIKLENFLLSKTGDLKLIDWGMSILVRNIPLLTKLSGTYHYLAPESLLEDCILGKNNDIWALGIMLYAMLVGEFPVDCSAENFQQFMDKVKQGQFPEIDFDKINNDQAKDLAKKILTPVGERYEIKQILDHPWISQEEIIGKEVIQELFLSPS